MEYWVLLQSKRIRTVVIPNEVRDLSFPVNVAQPLG
jgi:hypothetical protein